MEDDINESLEQKSSNPLIYIIISVIITGLIVGCTFYFFQLKNITKLQLVYKQQINDLEKQLSSKNQSCNDEISKCQNQIKECNNKVVLNEVNDENNLLSYQNKNTGIKIEYAKGWEIVESKDETNSFKIKKLLSGEEYPHGYTTISFKVEDDNGEPITNEFKDGETSLYGCREYLMIDNKEFYSAEILNWGMVGAKQMVYINNGKKFIITATGEDYTHAEVDQIIHNIKFVN